MAAAQLRLPAATLRLPTPALRSRFAGAAAYRTSPLHKQSITLRAKANSTSSPPGADTSAKHTEDPVEPNTNSELVGGDLPTENLAVVEKKHAIIHDFCLGIPFGGILFSMGLLGYAFWRSPVSLFYGIAPGFAIMALGFLSLKTWRSGNSSLLFILSQAAVSAFIAWKHFQAYYLTRKALPWGFYCALSAAMVCFYAYVLLAGGNPPSKKGVPAATAAAS